MIIARDKRKPGQPRVQDLRRWRSAHLAHCRFVSICDDESGFPLRRGLPGAER
jgi:hypothetical protein